MTPRGTVDIAALEALADSSGDAIVAADSNHRIFLFNQAAELLFGYASQDAIGLDLARLVPPSKRYDHRALVESFGAGEDDVGGDTAWRRMSERSAVSGLRSDGSSFAAAVQIMRTNVGGSPIYAAIVRDMDAADRAESLLHATMEGTASAVGEEFFGQSVRVLAGAIGCHRAFISEPVPGQPGTHRLLAHWEGDTPGELLEYDIAGTPCERAVHEDLVVVPNDMMNRYPEATWLNDAGTESWISTRISGSSGQYLAHLALAGMQPCFLTPGELSSLRIFASRIGAEIERLQSDKERDRVHDFGRSLWTSGPFGIAHVNLGDATTEPPNQGDLEVWSNDQFAEIVGRSLQRSLDIGWESIVHPDDHETFGLGTDSLALDGQTVDRDIRIIKPGGSVSWIHLRGIVSAQLGDTPTELTFFVVDLSTERAAQETLRKLTHELDVKNTELQLILSSFLDLGFRLRADGTFLDCWVGAPDTLLAPVEQIVGSNLADFFDSETTRQFLDAIGESLLHRDVNAVEYAIHAAGEVQHFEARFSYVEKDEVLAVIRDVSDFKRMENQLVHTRTVRYLGELAGGIAHDFNNVLHVVRGHASALERSLDDPERTRSSIEAIVRAVDRTSSLIDRLLVMSDTSSIGPEPTHVDNFIHSLATSLEGLLPSDIELLMTLRCKDSYVAIDESQFERVLLNLARNARDAMPHGGKLQIATTLDDQTTGDVVGHILIRVADTGEGMTPDIVERIFEPFFTTKPPGVGNGLGLATTFDAVTTAGGTITVDSSLGEGTTFEITLPAAARVITPTRLLVPTQTSQTDVTILLVDDESEIRELCADSLRLMGYRTIEATGGLDALSLLSDGHQVSLLLTDVIMPDMNGPELVAEIRDRGSDLPVVYMSGYSADLIPSEVLEGSHHLRKPFSDAELHHAIEAALTSGDTT